MRRPLHLYCGLLSVVAFVLAYGDELPDVPPDFHIVENYNEVNHTSYTPVKKSRAGVKGHGFKGKRKLFKGGCTEEPVSPINGYLTCSPDSGCRANCNFDYKFPNGEGQLVVTCFDGKWNIRGTDWTSIPHCEPRCMPQCQNNGICIAPNECKCHDEFSGPQCQFKNEPCLNPPPPIMFSERPRCNTKTCTVACRDNFIFPNGAKVTNLICKNGIWESTRSEWVTVPDCQPVCSPPCQNGGNCLPLNMCQCPQDFQGPQCQFSTDVCAPEKMGFNGGYRCSTLENGFACTLNCPPGVDFTAPPASEYLCTYEKGYFEPQPIPQCQTNGNFKLIPVESTRSSFYQITNHTWSFEDVIDISHKTSHRHQTTTFGERDLYDLEHSKVDKNDMSITGNRYITASKTVRPEAKTCFTWGGVHYKTFDGTIYNFESTCAYTLIQETRDNAFTVTVQNSPGCKDGGLCSRLLKIFVLGKEYSLALDTDGMPIFRNTKKNLPIPARLTSLRVELAANFVIATLDFVGLSIKWDRKLLVQIEASESLWNRTAGLCGRMNGDPDDDVVEKDGSRSKNLGSLTSSWRVERIGETCDENPNLQHSCISNDEFREEATRFCSKLLTDPRFRGCSGIVDLSLLQNACQWDYCACKSNDRRECACHTMNVYVRQCAHQKIVSSVGWRRNDTCPITCSDGRIYMACGPKSQPSCSTDIAAKGKEDLSCEEGCFCPDGTVLHEDKCISVEQCPCRLRGKSFQPGASVPKGCNTCTCLSGKWLCTQTLCSARCAAVGDPHYVTFDGKHYDFMGKCNYYLLKGNNYSIESENVACSGAISESMGYSRSSLTDLPSCTKSVTIRTGSVSIKLKQNHQVLVNGEDVTKLPIKVGDMKLRIASSIFLIVNMPNGLEVWWDSVSRVYINAPADFRGKTSGLCGTFTANQKDDFLTPDGDVEQSVVPFANKWKTNEICLDSPPEKFNHPCDANPQKRSEAKKQCSKLWSDLFSECHWHVDPEPFYKDCMFDMCACETSVEMCLCPTIAAYAAECANIGVKILWRLEVEECKIHCSRGQEYQICGNSCARSCGDISFHEDCKHECVEGCNCPAGQSLDVYGECIPIGQCPCSYAGLEFRAGYREVRSGVKSQELCTCAGGRWNCIPATPDDVTMYPAAGGLTTVCTASKNLKISSCEPIEPRTCRNMHKPIDQTPAVCKPGCVCKDGYVKDLPSGTCVKKEECPCYHGGRSYKEGSSIQEECNTCKCEGGKWNCTDRPCAGICTAWGDSHYKTFDGHLYDFQGVCDYVLVKARLSTDEVFEVSTQNVPCGSSGVTCSKSITFSVGNGAGQETITLTKGKAIPKVDLKRIAMRKVGLFVFLDCPDLGVVVQWDEGTRVYVKVHPKWRSHTKGLCGDYNDNGKDDYKTPSGGVSEVSARLFADSWKKEDYCAEPKDIFDTCAIHPERKSWATEKCGVLKTSLFQSCHSEVDLEPYLKKCIFDTCGCDAGGDCECLCTALAAYAHECNIKGVPVKWRSQELCPMQCDVDCSMYTPCMSACPLETCDNAATLKSMSHLCSEDTCVEGCQPKTCPDNQVYLNDSFTECVPKETCKLFCLNLDGVTYYEGDEIEADSCQSCFCSRGKIICSGTPCTTVIPETSTVLMDQTKKCIDGWSAWISKDSPAKGKRNWDVELLPSTLDLLQIDGSAVCTKEQMVDIRCRSVDEHKTPKETGLNVECSLERGLYCEAPADEIPCIDFEISVLCRCYQLNATTQEPTSTPQSTMAPTTLRATIERCNGSSPNQPHPTDCRAFYQCTDGLDGIELIEKNCGPDMMYNPNMQICDWPVNVISIRPDCGIASSTPSSTIRFTTESKVTSPDLCTVGESWSDCAVPCNQTCKFYNHQLKEEGLCIREDDCVAGCTKNECSRPLLWRDAHTCVDIRNCPCKSHKGHLVKPGGVFKESECEICQCLDDYYTCDTSRCTETTVTEEIGNKVSTSTPRPKTEPLKTTVYIEDHTILVTSHVSPAEECLSKNYFPLRTSPLESEMSFSASSVKNEDFDPKYWKLNGEVGDVETTEWQPLVVDTEQWLAVEFPNPEAIYGLIIRGSITEDKYVTSYKVLFSEDDLTFSYMLNDEGKPQVFRGPSDSKVPVQQIFHEPIEAKIIKINPQTWHKGIAMRVDVLGCEEHFTTPTNTYHLTTETPVTLPNGTQAEVKTTSHIHSTKTTMEVEKETVRLEETTIPVCDDPMGYDKGVLADDQIKASSVFNNSLPNLRISMPGLWRPKLDNPHQYVEFDFLEPRDLTGIETKGANDIWTSIYKVYYSMDGRAWNPVIDWTGADREFLGNFDDTSTRINHFDRPIHARYIKINPVKWHKHVGLKAEVHGCYLPYTVLPTTSVPKTSEPTNGKIVVEKLKCNVCDGIIEKTDEACRCMEMYWWNGETCVTKHECPCVVGSIPYAVGTRFETDDCQECICSLGGAAACQQKTCPPCSEPGLRSIVTELCACVCKPCAPGTRLCSTNNVCMNETLWCNGVDDCPGDETGCEAMTPKRPFPTMLVTTGHTTTINHTTTVTLDVKKIECEQPVCSIGYKPVSFTAYPATKSTARKGHNRSATKSSTKKWYWKQTQPRANEDSKSVEEKCSEFSCIPQGPPPGRPSRPGSDNCPKIACPPRYRVIFVPLSMRKMVACPKYTCAPPPPVEVVCNVTGRTFNTFDNLEYKYDICNHILARNMDDNRWYITLEKHCPQHRPRCTQVLSIMIDNDDIVLYPDMHVDIGDYTFTPKQVNSLGNNRGLFKISLIGDILYFVSNKYGFWVIWDKNSNVKIGVATQLATHVDGLCGYFDGNSRNDRQKPDGTQAKNTLDFGNSWIMDHAPQCEQQVCPPEIHKRAWEICGIVKDTSLRAYSEIINLDKFISRCMETTCMCMYGNATEEDCRCRALLSFVTDCQAADQSADLSNWRTIFNCPVQCPAPLVHKDCFRKKCETSCSNLQEADPCPVMPGVCFSGCFCPDGMVRHGEDCVYASECRDCVCNGFGNSKFVTFDKRNFTFQGNCTYTLSRDFNKDVIENNKNHTYEILMTNVPCEKGVCTEAIIVLYADHVIQIRKDTTNGELEPVIDGIPKSALPYKNDWLSLEDGQNHNIIVLIPAIQLEVTIFHHNFAFTIKLPSHTFGGATEGLCGNCNGIIEDDLKTKNDEITEDIVAFGMSWLATDQPASLALNDHHCTSEPPKQCNQETADLTSCKILEDPEPFGKCHDLIDPTTFIDSCRETVCQKGDVCGILEAYARSCLQAGLCLNWRTADICPYSCPPDLEYQACGSGCKRTCDANLKLDNCLLAPTEGCFCPEHHVFHNGSCVPEKNCLICDDEGHVAGDLWYPDKCTSCSCSNKTVTCQKTDCPALDAVCEEGYTPVSVPASEEHCCPKFFCVPVPTTAPTCIEPQQPECGFGQTMQVTVGGDGCQKIICECLPTDACPTSENDIEFDTEVLLPGYEQVMNTSGCCPRLTRICRPEKCPSPPTCPKYHEISSEQRPNSCCPDYECKPLKNICLSTTLASNDLPNSASVIGKEIGEVWKEGNCKTCTCESSGSAAVINCIATQCPDYRDSAEAKEFVVEEEVIESECCPVFKRKSCRQGENVYRVGDKWHPDPTDVCKIVECVNVTGKIEKHEHVGICNMDCDEGYEYRPSKNKSANCCGECIAVGCLVDKKMRNIGEQWYSADHCVTYSCLREEGRVSVRETAPELCPEIDPLEAKRFKLKQMTIPEQCCKKTVREACIYEEMVYEVGEKWMLKNDSCVTEMCVNGPDGVTVRQETKICDTMCRKGWTYEAPSDGKCCGECKQTMCIAEDKLYRPGAVWYSDNNCTTLTCSMQANQLVVSSSSPTCPDLADCPERTIYFDGCCRRCNITQLNQQRACAAEVLDLDMTIGILVEKHHKHGICRNLQAIKGVTECRGSCSSSTNFDTESWKQIYNCECCQPRNMQTIKVQLSCDDGNVLNREITVPTSCTCQACGSEKNSTKGRRKNVKA